MAVVTHHRIGQLLSNRNIVVIFKLRDGPAGIALRGIRSDFQPLSEQAALDAGYERIDRCNVLGGGGNLPKEDLRDRARKLVNARVVYIRAGTRNGIAESIKLLQRAQQGRIAGQDDRLELQRGGHEVEQLREAAGSNLDDRRHDAISHRVRRDVPGCRRLVRGADFLHLAGVGTLVGYPVMPTDRNLGKRGRDSDGRVISAAKAAAVLCYQLRLSDTGATDLAAGKRGDAVRA